MRASFSPTSRRRTGASKQTPCAPTGRGRWPASGSTSGRRGSCCCEWRGLKALSRADPPLYAAFFVLARAEFQPSSLKTLGAAVLVYVVLRCAGKVAGAHLGMRGRDIPALVRRHLGLCLISSSSLAIGLTIRVRSAFPDFAASVMGVALAAVLVFEIAGPILTRQALLRTGEAQTRPAPLEEASEPSLAP